MIDKDIDKEQENAELQEEVGQDEPQEQPVDECKKEIEELKEKLLRKQAEFDNFRRRTREEAQQLSTYVAAGIIKNFLPVLDNFARAFETADTQDAESLKKGMELIYRQMEKSLTDAGVEKVIALGEQFSPDWHEAVMNNQNPDLPDGQIDMVFEEGYKIRDKVIRHSKVRVISN